MCVLQRECPTDRIITHYYYPSWPDRGVPKAVSSLCAFTEHVRQNLESIPRLGPAVVHCRSDLQHFALNKTVFLLILYRYQMVDGV